MSNGFLSICISTVWRLELARINVLLSTLECIDEYPLDTLSCVRHRQDN